jgi:hypothetical protein
MKTPSKLFWTSTILPIEIRAGDAAERRPEGLLTREGFFDTRDVYKGGVEPLPHRHSIRHTACLRHGLVQSGPRVSIPPIKKDNETGVTTEGTLPKRAANSMLNPRQIDVKRSANRRRARRIGAVSGDNWQRGHLKRRLPSLGRRFPTPQSATAHVLSADLLGAADAMLPSWLPNSVLFDRNRLINAEGAAGGVLLDATAGAALTATDVWNFGNKWAPASS